LRDFSSSPGTTTNTKMPPINSKLNRIAGPVCAGSQEKAKILAIKRARHKAKPDHVDHKEGDEGSKVEFEIKDHSFLLLIADER
jgi:hypothetical protein